LSPLHQSGGSVDGFDRTISRQLLRKLSLWLNKSRTNRVNEAIDDEDWATMEPHSFCGTGYVVVTTYENLRRNADIYSSHDWSYVVLDEAQKIRNPDAVITLASKRIRTPHRLAISGTPIQNDLRELWSLFDFVFPGRLGTLPAFEQEFAVPIKYGGYLNASPMQVQLAYRCAIMLRDLIEPFLLRRLKKDVKEVSRMPGKTEHVLFCRLSQRQRAMYEAYLQSDDVSRVLRGNHMLLAAVTVLRKIANHPDLVCDPSEISFKKFVQNRGVVLSDSGDISDSGYDEDDYTGDEQGLLERSGKLEVLAKILPIWKKQGHRVLIFCQWRKMLNIIERFVRSNGWKFGRLDGNTNIASRQRLVDTFNTDNSYFGMLCTTRTGGVGLNLIGGTHKMRYFLSAVDVWHSSHAYFPFSFVGVANRCILYDPDWNPSGKDKYTLEFSIECLASHSHFSSSMLYS
jgi:DNA excision repair protein ERCC-6